MHCYTQQTQVQTPTQHQQSQQATPRDDFVVDERWDDGLFIGEQRTIKNCQSVEKLFNNMTISTNTTTELSPPLSSSLKCNQELFTSCFREDIDDDDDYFSEADNSDEERASNLIYINAITTPLTTPPISSVYEVVEEEQDCDYLNSFAAVKDNEKQQRRPLRNTQEEDDDLLIESVSDQPQEHPGPVSLECYHASLVEHYKVILFALSNDEMLNNDTLPPIYKQYLADLQQHMKTSSPCTF